LSYASAIASLLSGKLHGRIFLAVSVGNKIYYTHFPGNVKRFLKENCRKCISKKCAWKLCNLMYAKRGILPFRARRCCACKTALRHEPEGG